MRAGGALGAFAAASAKAGFEPERTAFPGVSGRKGPGAPQTVRRGRVCSAEEDGERESSVAPESDLRKPGLSALTWCFGAGVLESKTWVSGSFLSLPDCVTLLGFST